MQNSLIQCLLFVFVLIAFTALPACEGLGDKDGSECTVSNTISTGGTCSNDADCPGTVLCVGGQCQLKLHSEPCELDEECVYGRCHSSPTIAGFKFCTKRCDCGENSQCSDDNGNGNYYTCQRFSPKNHPAEELLNICTRTCGTNTNACPAEFNGCEMVTGAQKVCVQN